MIMEKILVNAADISYIYQSAVHNPCNGHILIKVIRI